MSKKSFVIYESWAQMIEAMPEEQAGKLIKAICAGQLGNHYDTEDSMVDAMLAMIRPQLDADQKKYEDKVARINKNANNIGTKSKRNRDDIDTKSVRKRDDIVSVSESESVSVSDSVSNTVTPSESRRVNYQEIVDMYNDTCVSLPRVTSMSAKRKAAIRARLRTHSMADIQEAFKKAEASDFLKGSNKRNWSANFDWIMNDANMAKILDGNYDNKSQEKTAAAPQNKFHNFNQREQDFSAIQTRLLQKQAAMTEDSG